MDECPEDWRDSSRHWIFDLDRRNFHSNNEGHLKREKICSRCEEFDIFKFLEQDIPWKTTEELDEIAQSDTKYIYNFGRVGSVRFDGNCPVCRCIFALTPTPVNYDQEILIAADWGMKRLEGGVHMDTEEKRNTAKCLLVTLGPLDDENTFSLSASRGDSLAILQKDLSSDGAALGARQINPKEIDYHLIDYWLSKCSRLHPVTCKPLFNEDFREIRLVDVHTRKVVSHPGEPCDYLALSYVWGGLRQHQFPPDTVLPKLPRTIEDAIVFVKRLRKRYLWVDSLCIDQVHEEDKLRQISRMSLIYRGAYATIVALSGTNSNSGLPRVTSDNTMVSQLSCRVDDKEIVGLMPNLSQYIWTCAWGTRAWTLQEALLSRRTIFISNHQMFFECNSMQCCESLDDTNSWVHNSLRDEEFLHNGHNEPITGAGVLRSPFIGHGENDRLQQYGVLTNLYNYRKTTHSYDAIHAFSGILQYLQEFEYKEGFFFGIPLEDFNWGLAWTSRWSANRRPGFPSWTWAGWDGYKWSMMPIDIKNPQNLPTYLHVSCLSEEGLSTLFASEQATIAVTGSLEDSDNENLDNENGTDETSSTISNQIDPLIALSQSPIQPQTAEVLVKQHPFPTSASFLFITGITFTFRPLLDDIFWTSGGRTFYNEVIDGVACEFSYLAHNDLLDRAHTFLLLAREQFRGMVFHYLLVLDEEKELVKSRLTSVILAVPQDRMDVLSVLKPEKRQLVLG